MKNKKRPYETADTLVYDPVASNRNATRASLHSLGFRRVDLAASLDVLEARIKAQAPDLLLAEVAGAEVELCKLIQTIRQGDLGPNPFLVVMVTTWRRDGTIFGLVVNSGADDLIARPFSTTALGERIKLQVERRKEFVVTSDYVGPERRRDPGRPASAPVLQIPNTLKLRTEGWSDEEAEKQIADIVALGKSALGTEKIKRDAVQLACQWRVLEHRNPRSKDFRETLTRMQNLADGIKRRVTGPQESAAEICGGLIDATGVIAAKLANEARSDSPLDITPWMRRLEQAASTIHQLLAPGESLPAHLVEVDDEVRRPQPPLPLQRAARS